MRELVPTPSSHSKENGRYREFAGRVPETEFVNSYNSLDAFVIASHQEFLGGAVVEAIASADRSCPSVAAGRKNMSMRMRRGGSSASIHEDGGGDQRRVGRRKNPITGCRSMSVLSRENVMGWTAFIVPSGTASSSSLIVNIVTQ